MITIYGKQGADKDGIPPGKKREHAYGTEVSVIDDPKEGPQ